MSTILPLEVVFGASTWSLAVQSIVVRPFDPSPLFGVQTPTTPVTDPHSERLQFKSKGNRFISQYETGLIEQLPHKEGLLGDGWDEHDLFVKSSQYPIYASLSNNIYKKAFYFIDVFSPDGKYGIDEWGPELTPGYRYIAPLVNKMDGTYLRPFEISDINAAWEEVLFTGECGSGGGSERPESGLLYPRKV